MPFQLLQSVPTLALKSLSRMSLLLGGGGGWGGGGGASFTRALSSL